MHPNEIVINDYIDDALDPAARIDVERHLETCAACRAIVADLREIRRAAASLDLREPPVRAWGRLERAIRLERDHAGHARTSPFALLKGPRDVRPGVWLAAAAAIALATVVGLRYTPLGRHEAAPAARPGTDRVAVAEATQSVEAELRQAEEHYDKAIRGLEQIANAEKGALDAQTAATLQKNLAVIDQAISESRAAVRAQPTSEPAQQSLIESFKAKLALLQDTVALINEMRKGNEAGAARIVSGLKQKS
jgi:anti-sigma factor RsiW